MHDTQEVATDQQNRIEVWFNEFVASVRADELALATGVASDEKKEMYHSLMDTNITDMVDVNVRSAKKHYISSMLLDYVRELRASNKFPFKKMAVSFNNAELLVWAEIENDNWVIEKNLIMTEAKINSIYHKKGFDMTTTIVEECDHLPVPNHYIMLYGTK